MSLIRADPEEMEKTKMEKRVFLIVLDSFGIGAEPDAAAFGDEGTNTLGAIAKHPNFNCPNLQKLGLFNIDGVTAGEKTAAPTGSFARLQEQSMGKDTTIGHWEIAGVVSPKLLPTFPEGFPAELIHEFEEKTGHKVLCNKPYSGTQVLKDYGEQAMKENALIVYTSADSVFQVAANEELVPVHELYRYCEIAREMLKGEYGVGRVIARPFLGRTADTFYRTTNRHDLSLKPPRATMLDLLKNAGKDVIAVTLPSAASYEKQYAAGMEALEARKEAEAAAARAAEEAAAAEAEAAERAAEESFMASPVLVAEAAEAALEAEEAADIVVRARIAHDLEEVERGELDKTAEEIVAERIAEEAHLGEDIQKKYALPDADFSLAFDQWTVVYADGSTRDFDSTSGILAD